jgi:glycosyltransferase involved in cell wall biosynthesis
MRVLMFCQLFPPLIYGGGETLFWNLARSLVSRGHEVHVITQRIAGQRGSERRSGVRIHRVGVPADYTAALTTSLTESLTYLGGALFTGIRIGLREHIDIIHSNTYVPAVAAQVCASILRKRHVMTVHDVYLAGMQWFWKRWSAQPNVGFLVRYLGPALERILLNMPVTAIHTVSETSKLDLLQMGTRTRLVVVPNAIDPQESRVEKDVSVKNHQAIFIGRLVFYKNLEVVLRALVRVVSSFPDVALIVVGDGPMKDAWQKMAQDYGLRDHVHFHGRTSQEEKLHLLRESAVLVLSSKVEGFGIVTLEAFMAGKPVLASEIGALREVVSDGVDGYLINPDSEGDWADKMIMLFQNPERARRMGLMGLRKATSDFAMDRIAEEMEHTYEQILKGTGKP